MVQYEYDYLQVTDAIRFNQKKFNVFFVLDIQQVKSLKT